jgi:tRNA threonylcarbamoyladenosine biosynthesis protein TsaE
VSPIVTNNAVEFVSHSADQTRRLGERLGRLLQPGHIVCLQGDLGAGKTCLAQGIGRGLGISSAITSPTFILVNQYQVPEASHRLYHVDLYRVETVAEARGIGLEDVFFGDDICVIEWAERVIELLPADRLWITLRYVDNTKRALQLEAHGTRCASLLERLRREAFGL